MPTRGCEAGYAPDHNFMNINILLHQSLINIYVIYTKLTHFLLTKFDIFVSTKEKEGNCEDYDSIALISTVT